MSPRSKREYLEAVHSRYKETSRADKTLILDEFCATCGYHRKHALRLLRRFRRYAKPKHKKKGRAPRYHEQSIILRRAMEAKIKAVFRTCSRKPESTPLR